MPKSSTTATPTTPRKRRTRKTSTTRTAKAVAKTDKVIKEIQAVLDAPRETSKVKVTKVKSLTRPASTRLITPSRYMQDIKQRWAIHNYEIKMLFSDFSKLNSYIRELETKTLLGQFKN